MNGAGGDVVDLADFNDLNYSSGNNMVGVRSSFGTLTAGVEYSVGVIYDPLGSTPTVSIGVFPTGGSLATESYNLTGVGVKNNWSGNDTISAYFPASNAGAGTNAGATTAPFREGGSMTLLDGAKNGAYLWNAQGTLIPEPATSGILGIAGLLLMVRRRR